MMALSNDSGNTKKEKDWIHQWILRKPESYILTVNQGHMGSRTGEKGRERITDIYKHQLPPRHFTGCLIFPWQLPHEVEIDIILHMKEQRRRAITCLARCHARRKLTSQDSNPDLSALNPTLFPLLNISFSSSIIFLTTVSCTLLWKWWWWFSR